MLTTSEPLAKQESSPHGFHDLAPELLSGILQLVRYSASKRKFTSCLLVCRRWSEIGLPFVWSSICLDNDSLEVFVESARKDSRGCELVRSLTLQLSTIWPTTEEFREWRFEKPPSDTAGANPKTYRQWNNLNTLADIVRANMTGLVSFSLCIYKFPPGGGTGDHWSVPLGAWMKTGTIASLLDALPSSCMDLELDTRGREDDRVCEFYPVYGSTHLCSIVRSLLPRLRHLRLRLGTLCSHLFLAPINGGLEYTRAEGLLSLNINLNVEPNSGRTLTHAEIQSDDLERDYGLLQQGLGKVLQDAYRANSFPRVRAIQTMDLLPSGRVMNPGPRAPGLWYGSRYDHYMQQDIIGDKLHVLPFRMVWREKGALDDETCIGHNAADEEFIGIMTELEPILENSGWVTTVDSDRWSTDFRSFASQRLASLRAPRFETRAEFLDRCESRFPVWAVDAWAEAKGCHSETKEGLCG